MPTSGHPDIESGHQPRIPGVRYRKVPRTRWVETTFNGETKLREQTVYEWEPVPPRNLDAVYLRAVITVAVMLTVVAAVWSTVAIGHLLGGLVPGHGWAGYLAATAFEIPWVTCLVVQWLLRFQPERAKAVNVAGWIGLAFVVTAVIVDGWRLGAVEVGAIGAFVSIVAKGSWWVVLRLFRVPLSEDAAGWLEAKREELTVSRVMLDEQQRMAGQQAYLAHVYGGTPQLPASAPATDTAEALRPDMEDSRSQPAPGQTTPPAPTAPAPVSVHRSPAHPDTSAPAPTPAPAPDPRQTPHLHAVGGPSIADTIRAALKDTPDIEDEDLLARVESVHGKTLRETVRRTRKRIERKAS